MYKIFGIFLFLLFSSVNGNSQTDDVGQWGNGGLIYSNRDLILSENLSIENDSDPNEFFVKLKDDFKNNLDLFLNYLSAHGTIGVGYGITLDGSSKGTLLSQSVQVEQFSFHIKNTRFIPTIQYSTLFNSVENNPDYALIGAGLDVSWFSSPPWLEDLSEKPVIEKAIFFNIKEWNISPSVNYPVDKLITGEFDPKYLIFGINANWKFNE